jgi:hypothetical protein
MFVKTTNKNKGKKGKKEERKRNNPLNKAQVITTKNKKK